MKITSQAPQSIAQLFGLGKVTKYTFFVHGTPGPQGSKSYKGMRRSLVTGRQVPILVESSKKVKPWREAVTAAASYMARMNGMFLGAVSVELEFYLARPKSRPARKFPHPEWKPDMDKLERATLDALTKAGVYEDDARVCHKETWKRYADDLNPVGARITVEAIV